MTSPPKGQPNRSLDPGLSTTEGMPPGEGEAEEGEPRRGQVPSSPPLPRGPLRRASGYYTAGDMQQRLAEREETPEHTRDLLSNLKSGWTWKTDTRALTTFMDMLIVQLHQQPQGSQYHCCTCI
ncbi:uncharacterized protein LOC144456834 [Phascolarctos cinereus]